MINIDILGSYINSLEEDNSKKKKKVCDIAKKNCMDVTKSWVLIQDVLPTFLGGDSLPFHQDILPSAQFIERKMIWIFLPKTEKYRIE